MNKLGIWWIVFFLLLTTGYSIKPRILEDVQLVTAFGFDYLDDNYVQVTAAAPISQDAKETPPKNGNFSAKGHTSKNIRQILQAQSPKRLMIGRADVVLYNNKLAEHGISFYVQTLSRDPEIGRNIYLGVVDGKVEEMLTKEYVVSETPSRYLSDLLKSNMELNLPKTDLHTFLSSYKEEVKDPIMPLLDVHKDKIRVKGIALFKKDKYKGMISREDSFLFKSINESIENGLLEIKLKDGSFVTIENVGSKVDYEVTKGSKPKATIHVSMKGMVTDAGLSFNKANTIQTVEKEFSKDSTRKVKAMIEKFQGLHVDPLGLGEKVRSQTRNFDLKVWKEHYPTMDIKVVMDIELTETGIVD
ncbi:Ger(x)C family spore germination protein [Peribacillus frigoritolerans]|uniref:Ger(x)C family spore germination protein n=1 Tax=Peribacillus frigoritolerans TaxID=450367 RepID=UPI0039A2D2AC